MHTRARATHTHTHTHTHTCLPARALFKMHHFSALGSIEIFVNFVYFIHLKITSCMLQTHRPFKKDLRQHLQVPVQNETLYTLVLLKFLAWQCKGEICDLSIELVVILHYCRYIHTDGVIASPVSRSAELCE